MSQQQIIPCEQTDHSPLLLIDLVEPTNKLRRLSRLINWELLNTTFVKKFQSPKSPSSRMIFALLYLQAKEDLSSEALLERWVKTPEWQYFCGEVTLRDVPPLHPSVLSVWGRELGSNGSKLMCAALSPSFAKVSVH